MRARNTMPGARGVRDGLAISTAVLAFVTAGAVSAQTHSAQPTGPTAAASAQTDASNTVGEIVVTAQKREQNLQNVPIVVNVAGAQLLQDTGVRDIKDFQAVIPGLTVVSSSNEAATTARIRGIGTVGDNPGLESSVGVVVDGVYRPRNGVGFGDIGELTRIEVLKGPQGTLFGKNTSAGVINILTAQPSFKFGANAEFTAGNYGEVGGSATVTGPLIADKLAGSLFFSQRSRDGFQDVSVGRGPRTVTDDQNRNFYTMRGQLLYEPSSELTARLILDYTRRSEDCCVGVQVVDGPTAALVKAFAPLDGGVANPPNPFNRLAYANRPTNQGIEDGGASLELNYSPAFLGGAKITSITAYRDWRQVSGQDSDFTSADLFYRPVDGSNGNEFKQFSEELRLGGAFGKLDYTVGGFVAHEKLDSKVALLFGNDFSPFFANLLSAGAAAAGIKLPVSSLLPITNLDAANTGQRDNFHQDDLSYAFFGNATYHLTDKLELTGGLRYTDDEKTEDAVYSNSDGGRACAATAASPLAAAFANTVCQPFANGKFDTYKNHTLHDENAVTGTGKLSYRFNPEYLSYVSYSRGYKSGGFNLDRIAYPYFAPTSANAALSLQPVKDTSFPGEFVDSYELGLKTTLLNRRLNLNGAIFYQDFTNYQYTAFNGLFFTVLPVPEVKSMGVDLDALWRPMTGLTVQGGLTYANTRFPLRDASLLGGRDANGNPTNASFATTYRLPGSRLSLAPLYTLTSSVTYEHPITDALDGRVNLALRFNSDYNTGADLDPLKSQGSFTVVDGRIGLGPRDKRWSVELWAQNLFDENYYQIKYNAPFQTGTIDGFLGQPRTFGVTLRAKY